MASKTDKSLIETCLENLSQAELAIGSVVEAFSELEVIKSPESYLFATVRALQNNLKYSISVLTDADKRNRSGPKTKQLSPDLQKE